MTISTSDSFHHLRSFPLQHTGDCSIIGIDDHGGSYIEESYTDDAWLAQSAYSLDGEVTALVDEDYGRQDDLQPLALPDVLTRPSRVWHTMRLNFTGPRHRGRRGLERVDEMVRSLTVLEKQAIIQQWMLPISLPRLLGLAESYVLAEAQIGTTGWFIVCRRLRFAYALTEAEIAANKGEYDYDTMVVYTAHLLDLNDDSEPPLSDSFAPFGGVTLTRPMDCVIADDRLYIAEGGRTDTETPAHLHIWRIDVGSAPPDPIANLNKKLYG